MTRSSVQLSDFLLNFLETLVQNLRLELGIRIDVFRELLSIFNKVLEK
jgi:hypothetical protein